MEELLAKYFTEEITDDERSLVETWRSSSKENAEAFFDAKMYWLESEPNIENRPDILASIVENQAETKHILLRHQWIKYAAAAVLVFAIGLLFLLNDVGSPDNYISKSFDDGSKIALHGDASVQMVHFDDKVREVKFKGMAYFDIERDENRPFIIHTDNATIKVLGTSFLIKTDDKGTEVCVESGLVELIKEDEDISVKLEKGKMGMILSKNEGIIKKDNDNPNYLSWKTKVITFNDNNMAEVKDILEQVYGINVNFEDANLIGCRLTAKFNKKKPKDALEIIARTFGLEYQFDGKTATLKGNGC